MSGFFQGYIVDKSSSGGPPSPPPYVPYSAITVAQAQAMIAAGSVVVGRLYQIIDTNFQGRTRGFFCHGLQSNVFEQQGHTIDYGRLFETTYDVNTDWYLKIFDQLYNNSIHAWQTHNNTNDAVYTFPLNDGNIINNTIKNCATFTIGTSNTFQNNNWDFQGLYIIIGNSNIIRRNSGSRLAITFGNSNTYDLNYDIAAIHNFTNGNFVYNNNNLQCYLNYNGGVNYPCSTSTYFRNSANSQTVIKMADSCTVQQSSFGQRNIIEMASTKTIINCTVGNNNNFIGGYALSNATMGNENTINGAPTINNTNVGNKNQITSSGLIDQSIVAHDNNLQGIVSMVDCGIGSNNGLNGFSIINGCTVGNSNSITTSDSFVQVTIGNGNYIGNCNTFTSCSIGNSNNVSNTIFVSDTNIGETTNVHDITTATKCVLSGREIYTTAPLVNTTIIPGYSNFVITYDITGTNTIDLTTSAELLMSGIVYLTSGNATESIRELHTLSDLNTVLSNPVKFITGHGYVDPAPLTVIFEHGNSNLFNVCAADVTIGTGTNHPDFIEYDFDLQNIFFRQISPSCDGGGGGGGAETIFIDTHPSGTTTNLDNYALSLVNKIYIENNDQTYDLPTAPVDHMVITFKDYSGNVSATLTQIRCTGTQTIDTSAATTYDITTDYGYFTIQYLQTLDAWMLINANY